MLAMRQAIGRGVGYWINVAGGLASYRKWARQGPMQAYAQIVFSRLSQSSHPSLLPMLALLQFRPSPSPAT
ncbi:unnamed protein product [Periconia digitata]|uniref:Uncharacterized protein n=1 Tax=Periconia digitata TaxID=1303443 RepID=A0A9W4UFJ8_9PLEO|nr:unnamed protein product [Periconia digitata]